MKRKSMFIGLVCFVVAITGIFLFSKNTTTPQKVTLSADYPKYDSLENLVDRADTIIKGKIIGSTYSELNITEKNKSDDEFLNPGGETDHSTIPYTIFTVEIEKTYKGNAGQKDTIQIKQLGGTIGNTEYVLEDEADAKLEEGKKYVFFLETYPDSPASLLNPIQASYEYDDNDNIISNKQFKQSEQNKINFKMEDLDHIVNRNK